MKYLFVLITISFGLSTNSVISQNIAHGFELPISPDEFKAGYDSNTGKYVTAVPQGQQGCFNQYLQCNRHIGEDWRPIQNLNLTGNDLKVRASGNGIVVFSQNPGGGW